MGGGRRGAGVKKKVGGGWEGGWGGGRIFQGYE